MNRPKSTPTTVFVAFCTQCGDPINASPTEQRARRSSGDCACSEGVNSDGPNFPGVALYRRVNPTKRSPRKRRKAWKP